MEQKYHEEYIGKLESAPSFSAERIGWLLSFIASTINKDPLFVEDIFVETKSENLRHNIINNTIQDAEK